MGLQVRCSWAECFYDHYPLNSPVRNYIWYCKFWFSKCFWKGWSDSSSVLLLALFVFLKHSPLVTEVPSSSGEAAVTHCVTYGWYPPLKGILSSHEQNEQEGTRVIFPVSLILGAFIVSWMPDFNSTATTNTSIYSEKLGIPRSRH